MQLLRFVSQFCVIFCMVLDSCNKFIFTHIWAIKYLQIRVEVKKFNHLIWLTIIVNESVCKISFVIANRLSIIWEYSCCLNYAAQNAHGQSSCKILWSAISWDKRCIYPHKLIYIFHWTCSYPKYLKMVNNQYFKKDRRCQVDFPYFRRYYTVKSHKFIQAL